MIDIEKAKKTFEKFLENYENKDNLGFNMKVIHTYHVMELSHQIATSLNLSLENIKLAELIALLHDIGRFEELKRLKNFETEKFNHASCGVEILFNKGLIRDFIEDDRYDEIIKTSIYNHNRLNIEKNLDDKCLVHVKIIRDADKIDNFRVLKDEKIENILSNRFKGIDEFINSRVSDKVYKTVLENRCIDIRDKEYPLDHLIYILAYIFGLNYKKSYEIVKRNDYINYLIDSYSYSELETKSKMNNIKEIMNKYINDKINIIK